MFSQARWGARVHMRMLFLILWSFVIGTRSLAGYSDGKVRNVERTSLRVQLPSDNMECTYWFPFDATLTNRGGPKDGITTTQELRELFSQTGADDYQTCKGLFEDIWEGATRCKEILSKETSQVKCPKRNLSNPAVL